MNIIWNENPLRSIVEVDECMKASGGSMNPNRLREIYRELKEEAGL